MLSRPTLNILWLPAIMMAVQSVVFIAVAILRFNRQEFYAVCL
jgi:hypothetical protein